MEFDFESLEDLADHLELEPHIEGGFFRETYRSRETLSTPRGKRNKLTNIYYCLSSVDFSYWHRLIDADETLFFHSGSPVAIFVVVNGGVERWLLGRRPSARDEILIPANTWFAMRPLGTEPFSIMSCCVEPGFEYEDLDIATPALFDEVPKKDHKLVQSLLKI